MGCIEMSSEKLLIRVSKNADGFVFRLDPRTKKHIFSSNQSMTKPADKLFIAYDSTNGQQEVFINFYQQVITILTGLSIDIINKLGSICFIDSVDESVLFEREPLNV